MRHVSKSELQLAKALSLSRVQRLERWAELLEADPAKRLNTLHETEFQLGPTQASMRADDSPISVAFADPVLKAAGLESDTYGEAKRFFGLSDWQLHDILCYCHHGIQMEAAMAARGVRCVIAEKPAGFLERTRGRISTAIAGG